MGEHQLLPWGEKASQKLHLGEVRLFAPSDRSSEAKNLFVSISKDTQAQNL